MNINFVRENGVVNVEETLQKFREKLYLRNIIRTFDLDQIENNELGSVICDEIVDFQQAYNVAKALSGAYDYVSLEAMHKTFWFYDSVEINYNPKEKLADSNEL